MPFFSIGPNPAAPMFNSHPCFQVLIRMLRSGGNAANFDQRAEGAKQLKFAGHNDV